MGVVGGTKQVSKLSAYLKIISFVDRLTKQFFSPIITDRTTNITMYKYFTLSVLAAFFLMSLNQG